MKLLILFLLAFATRAFALPITGALDIAGGATLDTASLATATQVLTFSNVVVTAGGVTPGSVLDSTINPGDSVAMSSPWAFVLGIPALWSVGGFTFDLISSAIVYQSVDFLNVKGTGFITGNGFDQTDATWFFSSQGTGDNADFSFSATTVSAQGVPDGGTTALLLGLGLVGAALASRIRTA